MDIHKHSLDAQDGLLMWQRLPTRPATFLDSPQQKPDIAFRLQTEEPTVGTSRACTRAAALPGQRSMPKTYCGTTRTRDIVKSL